MNGMNEMQLYSRWVAQNLEDTDLAEELAAVAGDTDAIKDRFFRDLEFGTGGLRGVIGAGTNRMNIYTVRKATQGLADYLKATYPNPSVAVSYDSRIKSDLFARETASVLAANGIKVYLYPELNPTPALSFAVRDLHCQAGVMITASHNPAKYNGYKAYGPDGCQMTIEAANAVLDCINRLDIFDDIRTVDFEAALADGWIAYIGQDTYARFLENVRAQSIHPEALRQTDLKVVYTPLNGTGNKPVREILRMTGVKNVVVVKEQELPDGHFTTCPYPNPEIKEALQKGLELCAVEKPDLLLATDPDCDRVGIAVPDQDGNYVLITGNEVGALLFEYICRERIAAGTMPERPVAVKTIVTTEIVQKMADEYGVELRNVLTGFKFIGEQIGYLEEAGEANRYIFGFEESYGYLAGTYVRDKDAVVASMLICEMAAFYRLKGISLLDALHAIYRKYGIYLHSQKSFTCEGVTGMERMAAIMQELRENPPQAIGGLRVLTISDYMLRRTTQVDTGNVSAITLPQSDVIGFALEQDASVIIRPSGTEPKIKAYYTATAEKMDHAKEIQQRLQEDFAKILGF